MKRTLVKTPLENSPAAGIFTLKKALPTGCTVNAVICTVAELVGGFKGKSYCASTVQLFTPSQGGFSQQFLYDSPEKPSTLPRFRCFWYLGPESEESIDCTKSTLGAQLRQGMFIGSAGDHVKIFGDTKVVTLAGYYGEASRKFHLHPGDILIMDKKNPYAIDLPSRR